MPDVYVVAKYDELDELISYEVCDHRDQAALLAEDLNSHAWMTGSGVYFIAMLESELA
jgi:hypothetical protein